VADAVGQTLGAAVIPLPGGAQAVYLSTGLAYYRHSDWLGSARLTSTSTQAVFASGALAPYGEVYDWTGTSAYESFTGEQQDTASGVYDFPARRLSASMGRWLSPDPLGVGAVNPANPQSWNRYAYVLNNPVALTDPTGLSTTGGYPIYAPWLNGDGQCTLDGLPILVCSKRNTNVVLPQSWTFHGSLVSNLFSSGGSGDIITK
jgi:RHS repeat-associated protein